MKAKRVRQPRPKEAKGTKEAKQGCACSPSGLTSKEKSLINECLKRARKEGAALEEAILQRLREELWRAISEDFSPETAKAWFAAMIAARRLALVQMRSDADARAKKETEHEKKKRLKRFFGIKKQASK
jgi:hypothetical protein